MVLEIRSRLQLILQTKTWLKHRGNRIRSFHIEENSREVNVVKPEEESDESRQTETVLSFMADNTTLHGARFLLGRNAVRRWLWTLAIFLCFGFCVYQVYVSMVEFANYEFSTKITTKIPSKFENVSFPAVTLCNYNHFNLRRFENTARKTFTTWSNEDVKRKLHIYKIMQTSHGRHIWSNKSSLESNPELTTRLRDNESHLDYQVLFSHRIEDMILPSPPFKSCNINGEACGPKDFKTFSNLAFGQCFTFNSGQGHFKVRNATTEGQLNGLKLLLNIERDSYLDNPISPFVGLTVLVHDQQMLPVMEQFGFAVQPGVRTLCNIKRKKVCYQHEALLI